jgi:CrcB protein
MRNAGSTDQQNASMANERALPHDPDVEVDEDSLGGPLPTHLTPSAIGLVFVGGSFGVLARASLDHAFPTGSGFPTTTFAINLVGALALAVLIETLAMRGPDVGQRRALRLLLGTGVLGGFTTYSALAVQTDALLRSGHAAMALAYGVATVALGLTASIMGIVGTRWALAR